MPFSRKIKIDPNDKLYSQIVRRLAYGRCRRCKLGFGFERLQCAHIIGRGHKTTRFQLHPKFNAIALCFGCHNWFDTHKIDGLIFDEKKRTLSPSDESYTWLVHSSKLEPGHWQYTWRDLYELYAISHHKTGKYGPLEKLEVKKQLQEFLKKIEGDF